MLLLSSFSIAGAQERAPHGIAYESPMTFSPSAYQFFHPNTENPCSVSDCSPLPVAAQVDESKALAIKVSSTPDKSGHEMGADGVAGIVFGLGFAVLLAMGVYYVLNTRRSNANGANIVEPDG
ncbi:hypothetical protein F3Y22_tig00000991pilonHSYRG00202 [Hibiscus syriacus]|uniref:Uncharacterized protein n=2 Tax=Hibiscus syriacus TaxID=106335 RepID=A0A6A3CZJ7_HIBSY|nr:hypothetical protein F3Y22_tig00000991pilonHSYRG00202 [Hibiscus syriacus]